MITYWTASGDTPARSRAALIATPPSCAAEKSLRDPSSRPMGVRAPATMTEPEPAMTGPPARCPEGYLSRYLLARNASEGGVPPMLTRIDHVGIACHDLDKTVEFYTRTYGFTVAHTEVNDEQGVREAMIKVNDAGDGGATYLQLLEPTREDSPIAKFLARNGEGVHHIAFGTADVRTESADIGAKGVRV